MRNLQIIQSRLKLAMARLFASFSASRKLLLRRNVHRPTLHLLVHHQDEIVVRCIFGEGFAPGCNLVFQHLNFLANVAHHSPEGALASEG